MSKNQKFFIDQFNCWLIFASHHLKNIQSPILFNLHPFKIQPMDANDNNVFLKKK
jgi:hypothetical protein